MCQPILVVNTGSSSLKMGIYDIADGAEKPLQDGEVEGIGRNQGTLRIRGPKAEIQFQSDISHPTQAGAFHRMWESMRSRLPEDICAVGHRVVHGGPHLVSHQIITDEVLQLLDESVHFAPLHIPIAVELIRESRRTFPGLPQLACFDTAFHHTLPDRVARFALPKKYWDEGVRRYGFHGLSYESILFQLGEDAPSRIVIAHLGSGASLAAVSGGRSIDTSMGLTPTGGVPMATRSGDIDPGVLLYLARKHGMDSEALEALLNNQSGLKALSDGTEQIELIEAAAKGGNLDAELAVEIFCLAVAKTVAAYSVSLGGLDLLIFTGGIGENSAPVRKRVCDLLHVSGVRIDVQRNEAGESCISALGSSVRVEVRPSQEDIQIARHSRILMPRPLTGC